jgi:small subunit ribosomal protein S20
MANTAQAKKRVRQNTKKRLQNTSMRSRMRTQVKKVRQLIAKGNASEATVQLPKVQSILDNYACKGLIDRNKASRLKSRINARLKALATKTTAA